MVEVFRTNVQETSNVSFLLQRLREDFPHCRINFDLDDCDRILRLEGEGICPITVSDLLQNHGFHCSVLDD